MEYIDIKDKAVCFQGQKQHPILSLPVEILCRIFIACLPSLVCTPDPSQAPTILCHICSHWRNIALDLPRLWNTLDLTLNLKSKVESEFRVTNADVWFSRSSTLPLILIAFIDYSEPRGYVSADSLGDLVVKYQSRFQTLSLKTSNHFTVPPSLTTLSNLHELETLEVKGLSSLRMTLTSAPKLRRLRLDVLPIVLSNIPWPQLTHVDLSRCDMHSCNFLHIISWLSNLVDGAFFVYGELQLEFPVVLPSLTRLYFVGEYTLLSTFSSPALERLNLESIRKTDYQQFPLTDVSNIKTLSLTLWAWDWMPSIGFFLGIPYLVSLTLKSKGSDTSCDSLLNAIQVVDSNPPILPHLEQLDLHLIPHGGFTPDVYCNAIVARCRHAENRTRLLRASLLYEDKMGGQVVAQESQLRSLLKPCIDDGLDFSVHAVRSFPEIPQWSVS